MYKGKKGKYLEKSLELYREVFDKKKAKLNSVTFRGSYREDILTLSSPVEGDLTADYIVDGLDIRTSDFDATWGIGDDVFSDIGIHSNDIHTGQEISGSNVVEGTTITEVHHDINTGLIISCTVSCKQTSAGTKERLNAKMYTKIKAKLSDDKYQLNVQQKKEGINKELSIHHPSTLEAKQDLDEIQKLFDNVQTKNKGNFYNSLTRVLSNRSQVFNSPKSSKALMGGASKQALAFDFVYDAEEEKHEQGGGVNEPPKNNHEINETLDVPAAESFSENTIEND